MAGIKIDHLPPVVTPALTDVFPIDQGAVTYQESVSQVLSLFQANGQPLTRTNDTNVTMTLGGSPNTALLNATSMTLGWSGQLSATRGGTGIGTYALGDTLYSSAANTLSKLSGNITSGIQYLSQTGTGAVSAAPAWSTISGGDITGAALSKTDDTNVTMTLGGTPTTALLRAASMTLGWTGQLSVARGGTGLAALTAHYIPIGNGTSALTLLAPSATSGIPLISQGAAADPAYGTAVVAGGGTGIATTTPYSVICAGTTATGPFQSLASLGNAGEQLTSNGAGALPTWQSGTTSPLTTKGDLYTFSTVNARLAVGTINGQILQVNSGAATGLAWSTATYPSTALNAARILRSDGTNYVDTTSTFADTYAASGFLYANGANNVAGLATANNGVPVTSNTGVPSILAGPAATGRVLTSNAAAAPSWSTSTFPSVGGAAGNVLISDGTNYIASTSLWPNTVGTAGKILRSDGTTNAYTTSTFADTYAANSILYASSANTVAALATSAAAVLTTVASVPTWAAQLSLALGGLNASLTASNGGIFYSTASAGAILSGTATAGLALLSGASTTPTWSTSKPITQVVVQVFAATGTYTPTTGMVYCEVEGVGGGGGSGGTSGVAGSQYSSGAGGGGAYSKGTFTAAAIGASKAVAIGAAGSAGAGANGAGGNGGTTTFGSTLLTAPGGSGGGGGATAVGGAGGTAGTGTTLALPGTHGGNSIVNGLAASNVFPCSLGGSSMWGQGGVNTTTNGTSTGNPGTGYGAGASGCNTYNTGADFAGGAGTIGYLIVKEYLSV